MYQAPAPTMIAARPPITLNIVLRFLAKKLSRFTLRRSRAGEFSLVFVELFDLSAL